MVYSDGPSNYLQLDVSLDDKILSSENIGRFQNSQLEEEESTTSIKRRIDYLLRETFVRDSQQVVRTESAAGYKTY